MTLFLILAIKAKSALSEAQQTEINTLVLYSVIALFSIEVLALLTASFGVLEAREFPVFYTGLVLVLLVGAYQFVRAVLEGLHDV